MEQNDQRNFLLAIGLTLAIFIGWEFLFVAPQREAFEAARAAQEEEVQAQIERGEIPAPATATPAAPQPVAREDVLAAAPSGGRISFDGPGVDGSISLIGGRIDDLSMKRHFETVEREEEVPLLSPVGAQNAFYAAQGWAGSTAGLPGESAQWEAVTSHSLTPETPIRLRYESGGLAFDREISLDQDYM
ncbi:MAG: membrane protein insertase YidC, partial [Pseudomonadota bacterium]